MFPPMHAPVGEPTALRAARPNDYDAEAFARYLVEHMAESGRDGAPHYALSRRLDRREVKESAKARWSRLLDEPSWARAWLLWSGERTVVGHVELKGGRIPAEMHRATLGIGMRHAITGKGHGRRLMEAAIGWARDEAKLAWIDLGVFSTNTRARKLYQRLGFVEQGMREDAFRIDGGVTITDVWMALRLR